MDFLETTSKTNPPQPVEVAQNPGVKVEADGDLGTQSSNCLTGAWEGSDACIRHSAGPQHHLLGDFHGLTGLPAPDMSLTPTPNCLSSAQ